MTSPGHHCSFPRRGLRKFGRAARRRPGL